LHQAVMLSIVMLMNTFDKNIHCNADSFAFSNVIYCPNPMLFVSSYYPNWCLTTYIRTTHKHRAATASSIFPRIFVLTV